MKPLEIQHNKDIKLTIGGCGERLAQSLVKGHVEINKMRIRKVKLDLITTFISSPKMDG